MNYSKNNKTLATLIIVIVLVVFNVAFFTLMGFDQPANVWVSYLYIHVAFLATILTPYIITGGSQSYLFGLTLGGLTGGYMGLTFVLNLLFMATRALDTKVVFVINLVITGGFLVSLISNVMANNTTADSVARHEAEVQYIKVCSMRLKAMQTGITDPALASAVERLYDLVHSSPSKSNANVQNVELEIITKLGDLEDYVRNGNTEAALSTVATLSQLAQARNRSLMMN